MPAILSIGDGLGKAWFVSPDILTDPAVPSVGDEVYVTAWVTNSGDELAENTHVAFYWAEPATQIIIGDSVLPVGVSHGATRIGVSIISVPPLGDPSGNVKPAKTAKPWIPTGVNGLHKCLVAVAWSPVEAPGIRLDYDPGNAIYPLPLGYLFDPLSHTQIAQKNVNLLRENFTIVGTARPRVTSSHFFVHAFGKNKHAHLSVEFSRDVDHRVLAQSGLRDVLPAKENVVNVQLSLDPKSEGVMRSPSHGQRELEVRIPPGTSLPIFVSITAEHLPQNTYQMVNVVERIEGKVVGGVSYLVVNAEHHCSDTVQ
jgi:hypothetical protein